MTSGKINFLFVTVLIRLFLSVFSNLLNTDFLRLEVALRYFLNYEKENVVIHLFPESFARKNLEFN